MLQVLSRPGFAGQATDIPIETLTPVPSISGRRLAHAKLTASQRAGIAAALQLGELRSERPTGEQVSEACRANRVYVRKARRATPTERRRLIAGAITIQGLSRPTPSSRRKNGGGWGALSDAALEAAVREIGVARVWDVIAKIID
jgi:hypothetical protein